MSQQTPYGPPSGPVQTPDAPHGQPAFGHGAPGYPPAGSGKTNTMAILGLVFAFVFSPLGIVFSAIGLSQTKKRQEGGRGLAIAGLILSILFVLLSLVLVFVVLAAASEVAQTAAAEEAEVAAPVAEPGADPQGIVAACEVIAPALGEFDAGVATASTPEEYALLVTDVRGAIEGAAATTTDPSFVQAVQTMSDNLQLTADAISNGEDPSYLDAALTDDDIRVGEACTAAGF